MQLEPFLKCFLTQLPRLISVGLLDGFHDAFGWVGYQGTPTPGGEREVTRVPKPYTLNSKQVPGYQRPRSVSLTPAAAPSASFQGLS